MDRNAIERALGLIEGIAWIVTENTITDALINAVEMIDNALKEPCVGEIAKEKKAICRINNLPCSECQPVCESRVEVAE